MKSFYFIFLFLSFILIILVLDQKDVDASDFNIPIKLTNENITGPSSTSSFWIDENSNIYVTDIFGIENNNQTIFKTYLRKSTDNGLSYTAPSIITNDYSNYDQEWEIVDLKT